MTHLPGLDRRHTEMPATSSYIYMQSECNKFEGVDGRQFHALEIEQALSMLGDRRMLVNTMCSGNWGNLLQPSRHRQTTLPNTHRQQTLQQSARAHSNTHRPQTYGGHIA